MKHPHETLEKYFPIFSALSRLFYITVKSKNLLERVFKAFDIFKRMKLLMKTILEILKNILLLIIKKG